MGRIETSMLVVVLGLAGAGLVGCGEDSPPSPLDSEGEFATIIDTAPTASTSEGDAIFEFHATWEGSTFRCRVDDAAPVDCESPFTATVAEGDHVFVVTATDRFHRPDQVPPIVRWQVDQTNPDVDLVTGPADVDNSPVARFEFGSD